MTCRPGHLIIRSLTARIEVPSTGGAEQAVVELASQPVWISEPVTQRKGRHLTASVDIVPTSTAPVFINRSELRFTVIGSKRAVDIQGCSGG